MRRELENLCAALHDAFDTMSSVGQEACPKELELPLSAQMKSLYNLILENKDQLDVDTDHPRHSFSVNTPAGIIRADEFMDDEYPGILLTHVDMKGQEGASMLFSYNDEKDNVDLHVWSYEDPDGDPVEIRDMSKPESVGHE